MSTIQYYTTMGLLMLLAVPVMAEMHYVDLNSPNPTPPFTNWLTAATNIQDAVDTAVAGDLVLVANGVYQTGGRAVYGLMTNRVAVDRPLTLQSVNGPGVTIIKGYQLPSATNGDGAMRCVYLTDSAVLDGFTLTGGATRTSGGGTQEVYGGGAWCESTNALISNCVISDNVAALGGAGVFQGTLSNSFLINNRAAVGYGGGANGSVLVQCSVSGNSAQEGGGAHSCSIDGCLMSQNNAYRGGGIYISYAQNCLIVSNTAFSGGGANNCTLLGCRLIGNSAGGDGGGAVNSHLENCLLTQGTAGNLGGGGSYCTMKNCTVVANDGVGVFAGGMINCIIYFNYVGGHDYNTARTELTNCCTTLLSSGGGNITNTPLFMDTNGWSNLRLQSNSPCINAGNNAFVSSPNDLDGNTRIIGGTVDIGAYEFQSPSSILSYAWAQQYGLPTDGSADFTDNDTDGMNNYGEWRSDTNPTNDLSVLRMVGVTNSPSGAQIAWQSASTRTYWLERATNLGASLAFQSIATNLLGVAGTKTHTDTSATNNGTFFYRVGVQQ